MFVEIDVCCSERPMDSATAMKRLANKERSTGSALVMWNCNLVVPGIWGASCRKPPQVYITG